MRYPPSKREHDLERALRVMVEDQFIRTFLTIMDPQALKQAEEALGDTAPHIDPTNNANADKEA